MKSFVAIMEVTPDNRVAKYMDFDTQTEAQAHVDDHTVKYPLAFVHTSLTDSLEHWLVNMIAQKIISSPDSVELNKQVEQVIRAEGMQRVQAFMEDSTFDIADSIHLLYLRANGAAWTVSQQNMVDSLTPKFSYVRDIHVAVKQAIAGVSSLSNTERINFNVITGVSWPVKP